MLQYWQQLIVFFIVLLAALHACAKYMPVSWRQRVVYLLTRRGATSSAMAAWLAVDAGCGGGCSSCKSAHPCIDANVSAEPEPTPRRVIRLHLQPHTEPDITPHR